MKPCYRRANVGLEAAIPGFLEMQRRDVRFLRAVVAIEPTEPDTGKFYPAFAEAWHALSQLTNVVIDMEVLLAEIEEARSFINNPDIDVGFYKERYG